MNLIEDGLSIQRDSLLWVLEIHFFYHNAWIPGNQDELLLSLINEKYVSGK